MKKLTFPILACALAFCLCSCARMTKGPGEAGDAELASRWRAMENLSAERPASPFRLQLSLRFGDEGNTRRVTAILWGNDASDIRLDVMAGVGATIALVKESGASFLLYAPRDNKAYFHDGPTKPLLKIGIPLPFDLSQLAALLNGRFANVFGSAHANARMLKNGQAAYDLEGQPGGTLELAEDGLPVGWKQSGPSGWRMEIGYDEGTPQRLKLDNPDGKLAILLVKGRETPKDAFSDQQMRLDIPAGVPLLPLAKYKP